jgi:hypothetical protein
VSTSTPTPTPEGTPPPNGGDEPEEQDPQSGEDGSSTTPSNTPVGTPSPANDPLEDGESPQPDDEVVAGATPLPPTAGTGTLTSASGPASALFGGLLLSLLSAAFAWAVIRR